MLDHYINNILIHRLNSSVYYKDGVRMFSFSIKLVVIDKWQIDRMFLKAYNSLSLLD